MANPVDCDVSKVAVGQRVKVVLQEAGDGSKVLMVTLV